MARNKFLTQRLNNLETHLNAENPLMLELLPTYYKLDKMLYKQGLLDKESSLATRISWWPVISVLGTFSSGKSTFINAYLQENLQATGNQAVDDKFTVLCYASAEQDHHHTLPGTALDGDARFPFYRMSREIEKVAEGEGKHIESYLQLKTTTQEIVHGKIFIDSPGFDADDQRRSTLRITDHIIDLSDLVLVFFDARHPEPGAMQDTLTHLVSKTVARTDASKFLYILNQIDTTAKEDNPEEVVGAWQRAIAQAGLASGRFYCIYNPDAAVPIEDEALRRRFESKRDNDLSAIQSRIAEVEIQRNYRVIRVLETVINEVETELMPLLSGAIEKWRRWVMIGDAVGAGIGVLLAGLLAYLLGWAPSIEGSLGDWLAGHRLDILVTVLVLLVVAGSFHFWVRDFVAKKIAARLPEVLGQVELNLRQAFLKNAGYFSSVFRKNPIGWSPRAAKRMLAVRELAAQHVQRLNDRYADPSGKIAAKSQQPVAAATAATATAVEPVAAAEPPVETPKI